MRRALFRGFVAVALCAAGLAGMRAAAATVTVPAKTTATLAAPSAPPIREAAIVCGGNGCNAVQTKAAKRRKFQTLGHG